MPRVDLVSGIGRDKQLLGREGPLLILTPVAVMDFQTDDNAMRLRSIHPSGTVEEVLQRTGFPLRCENVELTAPPTPAELVELRTYVDPHGVLQLVKVRR